MSAEAEIQSGRSTRRRLPAGRPRRRGGTTSVAPFVARGRDVFARFQIISRKPVR
jgi:hypothetical protein